MGRALRSAPGDGRPSVHRNGASTADGVREALSPAPVVHRGGGTSTERRTLEREERVILVDAEDREVGTATKMEAHERGELHRAFSVFGVNSRGEILLQRRAFTKYHGGGLWSNSCCGHPRPGESTDDAARRRLREEMDVESPLERIFSFRYRAEMAGGLIEHEIDHVFVGRVDEDPRPDPAEVEAWRWLHAAQIRSELRDRPEAYTPWFERALMGLIERRIGGLAAPDE